MSMQDIDTISLCLKCYTDLYNNIRPVDSLANFRWIGLVPLQLQDLTWVEEALAARSHLFGRVFRLQERKSEQAMYSYLKGHIV